jgi:YHS domain-containing protein
MTTDPVCGMRIDEHQAAARTDYHGTTYYFCSASCKTEFVSNPDRYVAHVERRTSSNHHGPQDAER